MPMSLTAADREMLEMEALGGPNKRLEPSKVDAAKLSCMFCTAALVCWYVWAPSDTVTDIATAPINFQRPRVWFDIHVAKKPLGRIVVELYSDVVPRTAENFRALATGERGFGASGKPLWYKSSIFHRVIPGFMLQGGDITLGNGRGGESIYGRTFEDENFTLPHDRKYILSMANKGPNTGSSQFFITVKPTPWLNGKHVVFGHVVSGQKVVDQVEALGSHTGKTKALVTIADCGELPM